MFFGTKSGSVKENSCHVLLLIKGQVHCMVVIMVHDQNCVGKGQVEKTTQVWKASEFAREPNYYLL